jgi:hypothetical protein
LSSVLFSVVLLFSTLTINHNSVTYIKFEINNKQSNFKSISTYYGFDYFDLVFDAPELINIKTTEQINFTYSGGSGASYASDLYTFLLADDCSDFILEIDVDYSYNGTMLGEFFVSLNSSYSEDGSPADEYGEYQILEVAVKDMAIASGVKCKITGFPNDTPDDYVSDELTTSYFLMIRIRREGNQLTCEIDNLPDFYFSHVWNTGVSKPLTSICVGGTIRPFIDNTLFFTFSYFYAEINYGESSVTPTTPTTSINDTTDLPNWVWYIMAGAGTVSISVLVIVFALLNKKYK